MRRDSVSGTLTVAIVLCVVCSVLVSSAAVGLRPFQEANKKRYERQNILAAAGYTQQEIQQQGEELFKDIQTLLINLDTGEPATDVDLAAYDQKQAAKDPQTSVEVAEDATSFGFKRREKYSKVYLLKREGELKKVILPIYGKGLWSTLYGFIALEGDLNTVAGITFYEHKETPGLGGEVDNPQWKAQWEDKLVRDEQGDFRLEVLKGEVPDDSENAAYQIDGLSGATITSRGVSNAVQYWLQDGFGPFLEKLKAEEGSRG